MNQPPTQQPPVQYGQGQQFQNTCPPFPPAPPGYVVWNTTVNGPVPADVQQQANALAKDMTQQLGTQVTVYSSGVPVIVRVDPHPFTYDSQGNIVPGCYHGATVYAPILGGVTPPAPGSSSVGGTLFTLSLVLGVAVSAISLIEYARKRKTRIEADEPDEPDEAEPEDEEDE